MKALQSRSIAGDGHAIGRIGEDELGFFAPQESFKIGRASRITAQQPVRAEEPQIAQARHKRDIGGDPRDCVGAVASAARSGLFDYQVELGDLETGILEIELDLEFDELGKLSYQEIAIPAGEP